MVDEAKVRVGIDIFSFNFPFLQKYGFSCLRFSIIFFRTINFKNNRKRFEYEIRHVEHFVPYKVSWKSVIL